MKLALHNTLENIRLKKTPYNISNIGYWKESQNIIKELEEHFGTRVINIYISSYASLSDTEVSQLYHHLRLIGQSESLTVVIYGYGGNPMAAYRIVSLLRRFAKNLMIIVPEMAASAMTMLALGANKLFITPVSVLTPIDTSIAGHPLAPKSNIDGRPVSVEIMQIQKYFDMIESGKRENLEDFTKTVYADLNKHLHPVFLGSIRRSVSLSEMLLLRILRTHIADEARINDICKKINSDFPTHSFPLLSTDLEELGVEFEFLNPEIENKCSELLHLYNDLKSGWTSIKNDMKDQGRRFTFIESLGIRSYYLSQEELKLIAEKWVPIKSSGNYEHASYAKKDEEDFYEVRLLKPSEFKTLFNEFKD